AANRKPRGHRPLQRIRSVHPARSLLRLRSCFFLPSKQIRESSMEVVLNRDAFLKGLQMVQNIVEPRQTLPILANVLLETDGETVRLTATDLEVGARVTVPARVTSKSEERRVGRAGGAGW